MASSKRPLNHNGPPALNHIDILLSRNNGSSIAIDASQEHLQASKTLPALSAEDNIIELNRVQGRLRRELTYSYELNNLGRDLVDEVDYVVERLRIAIINFKQGQKDVENEFSEVNTI
jgi:hypothetical protein